MTHFVLNTRLLVAFIFLALVTQAQEKLNFSNYTLLDGFPQRGTSFAHTILQDQEGFVWFSTYNGLARFDGEQFKNYLHDPSNPNSIDGNLLTALAEDDYGRIWIGTVTRGIYIFDKKKESFSFFNADQSDTSFPINSKILFISKDHDGNMWYGSEDGLKKWNKQHKIIEDFEQYFESAYAFLQQKNGIIWIGDIQGLHRLMPGSNEFEQIDLPGKESTGPVIDIFELENEHLLISAVPGLSWEFDPSNKTFNDLKKSYSITGDFAPENFEEGMNGDIWMRHGTEILKYNQRTSQKTFYRHHPDNSLSLPPSTIIDILFDNEGNLFLQTAENGMAIAHTNPSPFELIDDLKAIEFLTLDSSRLLIRDFNKGGLIYDTKKRGLLPESLPIGPGNTYCPTMALRGDSLLWFLDRQQVKSYHLKTAQVQLTPPNPAGSLYITLDKKGRVWNGLSYLNEKENRWVNILPELQKTFEGLDKIRFSYAPLYFDDKNNLWAIIQGYYGLIRYNLETQEYKRYSVDANHFVDGTEGKFYLITTEGLRIYQPDQDTFLYLSNKKAINSSTLFYAQEDTKGDLWLATPKGLQRYNWSTGTLATIDYEDGFPMKGQTLVRRGVLDKDGYLYFDINMEKVFRFHPDSLHLNQEKSPVHILDFYLNHQIMKPGTDSSVLAKKVRFLDKIKLNYTQSDFGFSFTMPVFYKSKQIEYFYRLVPYQQKWQSNGTDNAVHFTNIDPGKYTFEVKARSASGIWSTNKASIRIHISPPWWQSWWAYLSYVLILISILYSIFYYEIKRRSAAAEARRLNDLDALKTRLYTNITHEFRTPLTVIMGMADNLKENQQERNLIRRNSKNLLRLINQLLDLSKLDSGSMKMDMVRGDIVNYLRYLTESFYSLAQEKNIKLSFDAEVKTLIMDFDEVKIQHIIYNLLSNALKFTPSGGQVSLKVKQQTANGISSLFLAVTDTGIGMTAEDQEKIFNRFYQSENSSSRKGEGTGIGLALTKELVEIMDGAIKVESRVGAGSQFSILFPIKKSSNTPVLDNGYHSIPSYSTSNIQSINLNVPHESLSVSNKQQLLLIEDNKDVATYIEHLLKGKYQLKLAKNGQEGIDMAIENIPDIIISDVMMPEKDGYEVCQTLKTDERTSHIPIILLTAKAAQKDKVVGLQHGADAYLMKPFDKEELFVRLEKLLELRRALQARYSTSIPTSVKRGSTESAPLEDLFLQKVREAIQAQLGNADLSVAMLCTELELTQMQLYRKIKALTGKSPTLFIRSFRLHQAMELLRNTSLNVSEVAYQVGFSDPAYFSRAFKEEFDHSPSSIRN